MDQVQGKHPQAGLPSRWIIGVAVAVLSFYLWSEHRAHLLGALPWLLILSCPLLHMFMHRGHGGHNHHEKGGEA